MITQEQLEADRAAVEAAQAKLAADQAEYDRAQPHLSVLAEIENLAGSVIPEMREQFSSLIAKARSLF